MLVKEHHSSIEGYETEFLNIWAKAYASLYIIYIVVFCGIVSGLQTTMYTLMDAIM